MPMLAAGQKKCCNIPNMLELPSCASRLFLLRLKYVYMDVVFCRKARMKRK